MPFDVKFSSRKRFVLPLLKWHKISLLAIVIHYRNEKMCKPLVTTRFFLTFAVLKTGAIRLLSSLKSDADVAQLARAADL